MNGWWMCFLMWVIFPLPSGENPHETDPKSLRDLEQAICESIAGLGSLAVVRPELTGADRGIEAFETWLLNLVAKQPNLRVISPDEVMRTAGVEFEISPQGLSEVARKTAGDAVLFLRIVQATAGLEMNPLLVRADGTVLLDRSFMVNHGCFPEKEPEGTTIDAGRAQPSAPSVAEPPLTEPPPDPEVEQPRQLPRELPGPEAPTHPALVAPPRLEDRESPAGLAVALLLAGTITSGLASPWMLSPESNESLAADIAFGAGCAVALTGFVLWLLEDPPPMNAARGGNMTFWPQDRGGFDVSLPGRYP